MKNDTEHLPTCEECGLEYPISYMNSDNLLCEDCAYDRGEPIEPWQPDPMEDGGFFGWGGMTEA